MDWGKIEQKWTKIRNTFGNNYLSINLRQKFHTELIYISSNLEGICISREEISAIVAMYPAIPNMDTSKKAVKQAIGQKRALELLDTLIESKRSCSQEYFIKQMHYEIFKDISPNEAGQYRTEHRNISGSKIITSMPYVIAAEMHDFVKRLSKEINNRDEFDLKQLSTIAAGAHHEITRIHPFSDGNGRIARLYMNYIYRSKGLPYILLPKVGMKDLMNRALKAADRGEIEPYVNLCGQLLENSLDYILEHVKRK